MLANLRYNWQAGITCISYKVLCKQVLLEIQTLAAHIRLNIKLLQDESYSKTPTTWFIPQLCCDSSKLA